MQSNGSLNTGLTCQGRVNRFHMVDDFRNLGMAVDGHAIGGGGGLWLRDRSWRSSSRIVRHPPIRQKNTFQGALRFVEERLYAPSHGVEVLSVRRGDGSQKLNGKILRAGTCATKGYKHPGLAVDGDVRFRELLE